MDHDIENHIKFEKVDYELPADVRAYYMAIFNTLPHTHWPVLLALLENTLYMCVPSAILKEVMGRGTVVLGKLGFSEPAWEFGQNGVYFG